jgi:hypothetical protein
MKKKIILPVVILMIWALPASVFAIMPPDTYQINQVNVYQSTVEANDQLYLIAFTLLDSTPPTEHADEAWVFILRDEADNELGSAVPYAYHDNGYTTGIVAIQLTAAGAPTWGGNYTIEMIGNPLLDWGGDPPSTSTNSFAGWSTDSEDLTPRLRVLAKQFEADWNLDLIETIQGKEKLTTTYGEDYFETSISGLRNICPDLFSALVTQPEWEERAHTQAGAATAEARWGAAGVDPGGLFDFTNLGNNLFGIGRMWVTTLLYWGFAAGTLVLIAKRTESTKPGTFIFGVLLVIGAGLGFMPLAAGIFTGVLGGLAIVYSFMYQGSA